MALTRPKYSNFVDNDYKNSCRIVTTTSITLAGGAPSTYDGVTLAVNDRVLVASQGTGSQNGIYIVATVGTGSNGTWTRSFDANDGNRLNAGAIVTISEGTYAARQWRLATPDPITVGVTALTWIEGTAAAGGSTSQIQFNNSGSLQGVSTLSYVSANTTVVASGNVYAATLYTDNIRWASNAAAFALTGNINPAIYIGNTVVGTSQTLVDSILLAGNTMVRWTTTSKDVIGSYFKTSTIDAMTDGSAVYYTETNKLYSNPNYAVSTFTSNVNGSYIQLWAAGSSGAVTVTYERRLLGSATPTGYINNFGPQGIAGTISATGGNIVTTSSAPSTSTTTGALQVAGGAGIGGNIYIGANAVVGQDLTVIGNLYVQGDSATLNTTTLQVEDLNITLANGAVSAAAADGAGISVYGAGATFNYYASTDAWTSNKKVYATSFYTGSDLRWSGNSAVYRSGINYTTSTTAPINSNFGDQWYDTSTDILYEWQTADGTNGFWIDIGSLALVANVGVSSVSYNVVNANTITASGNITGGNVVLGGVGSGYVYANNFVFSSNGQSIFASFGVNSYGNVQVAGYLPQYTGNIQASNVYVIGNDSISSSTGALRVVGGAGVSGNIVTGGNIGVGSNANYYNVSAVGRALTVVAPAGKTAYLEAIGGAGDAGLVKFGNTSILHAQINTTTDRSLEFWVNSVGAGNAVSLAYSIDNKLNSTFANTVRASGTVETTAAGTGTVVTSGGLSVGGNAYVANNLYIGSASFAKALTTPTIVAVDNGSTYAQLAMINSAGTGSADFAAYADNGTDSGGWVDMGIAGSAFNDPAYTFTRPQDGYLITKPLNNTYGGNLAIATSNVGNYNDIVFSVGSFFANAEVARFHGNATTNGYLSMSSNIALGAAANYYNSAGAGKGLDIVATTASKAGYLNIVGGSGSSGLLTFGNISSVQAVITTGTDNSIAFATKSPTTGANTASVALTLYSDQTARLSGNLTVGQSNGNILVTNGYISGTYTPATATGSAIQLTGKDTQGGTGWFDFLKATNITSGATNPNKTIRLNSTGFLEIINSAYTATIFSLSDAGALSVSGNLQVAGKKAVNGPAFSAYADNTLQTITSGSQQKVLFQVEEFDTDGCYASSRFTPTVEGYYQLNAEVRLDGSSGTGEIMIVLYKNTSEHKRGTNQSGSSIATNFWAMQVSSLVYANGTTDYFEIKVQQTSGSSVSVTAVNNPAITWFNGAMVRGA
jgi:hypothetical protein